MAESLIKSLQGKKVYGDGMAKLINREHSFHVQGLEISILSNALVYRESPKSLT